MAVNNRLEQIEAAIEEIESGAQEFRIGTQLVKKADLATLYAERRRLEKEQAQECGGDGWRKVVFHYN